MTNQSKPVPNRLPKNFLFFLVIAQGVLLLFHGLVFYLLISFFPALAQHWVILLILIFVLGISFFSITILDHKFGGSILRIAYILSSVWLIFSFYFVLASAITLILYLFGLTSLIIAGWLAVCTALLLISYGLINARITQVINLKIKLPNLPSSWIGKTAVVVSDLHFGHILYLGFAEKIINLINQQKPDIVFIPGDFYDGADTEFHTLANQFKKVHAPLGIYFSSGNHEMLANYSACESALKNAGIKILEDEKIEIEGMQILGLAYTSETEELVSKRLEKINLDKQKPSILLKHVPTHIQAVSQAGISLQLSGHTHHGQIWPFRYITNRIFKGFDYGLNNFGQTQVYTSSGAGTWGPPLRVFTKSEIIKIIFE